MYKMLINLSIQNAFVLNVLCHDVALGILGTVRGLGIIDKVFMGVSADESVSVFCSVFSLIGHVFW